MPYVNCQICAGKFYAKPRHLKRGWGKYCSQKCQYIGMQKGIYVKCKTCSKEVRKTPNDFKRSKSGNFFCDKSCQTIWRNKHYIGPKSTNWKNGIGSYREILSRVELPKICVLCKTADTRVLAVHHLDKNRNNNNIENLIWLCCNCHFLVHHHRDELLKLNNILNEVRSANRLHS